VHGVHVPIGYMTIAIAYAAVYISAVLAIAMLVFSRRDFK